MLQLLPNELLMKILEYLPLESLVNIAEICASWSHMARKLGVYRLDISKIDPDHPQSEKKMISYIKTQILTFANGDTIRYLFVVSPRLVPSSVFLFIQFLFPNVNIFDYDYNLLDITKANTISWHSQRHSLLPCGGWQHSITHLPPCFDGVAILARDDILCRRLKHLHVGHDVVLASSSGSLGGYRLLLQDLPQLESLAFHCSFQFDEAMLSEIHRRCPQLQSLTMRDITLACSSDRAYPFQREVFFIKRGLKSLKLENVTFLTYDTYCFFPKKYPNVETLVLTIHCQKNRKFGGLWNDHDKNVRESIYEMIVGFKCLSKVDIHMIGFGKKKSTVNVLYQNQIVTYFLKFLNKHIQVHVKFS